MMRSAIPRQHGTLTGLLEIFLVVFILTAVVISTRLATTGNSVLTVLLKNAPQSLNTTAPEPGAFLQYLDTHYSLEGTWDYCWMNADYFLNKPVQADPRATKISQFSGIVTSGELVVWQIDTFSTSGRPLGRGGDTINLSIEGPSLLRPTVYDLRNGTYLAVFSVVDQGTYTATLSMRWKACFAYAFCQVEDTYQPIDHIKELEFTVVKGGTDAALPATGGNGRWVESSNAPAFKQLHALLQNDYVWMPFGKEKLKPFPTDNLQDKWVYFVGDSLSEHAFDEMLETIFAPLCGGSDTALHILVNRYDGKRMKTQWKRDGMQLYHCPTLNLTMSFVFYPDSFPVGGFKNTRFPLINETTNSIAAAANVTFKVPEWTDYLQAAMKRHPEIPSHTFPDAVIFNFGLHYATPLDPPLYRILLRHMFMMLRQEFSAESTKTRILWRSTAWTHFEKNELAVKWNCRTPVRTQIMNEISRDLVQALGDVETIDFQELTGPRADATPDNRHFSNSNVRATYNNLLLNKLDQLFSC